MQRMPTLALTVEAVEILLASYEGSQIAYPAIP